MGILFTIHMGFLFTITLGILFTIVLGIQFTISNLYARANYQRVERDRSSRQGSAAVEDSGKIGASE